MAKASATLPFVSRVLKAFDNETGALEFGLSWHVKYQIPWFAARCNEVFFPHKPDSVPITPENIGSLEATIAEVRELSYAGTHQHAWHDAHLLWCCRQRGMRPHAAYYSMLDSALIPLFNACGPEREPED